jgi:geranylgeranyl pyrophosphate synthase
MIENLKKYAMELGYVFQLRDDWLGEYGDSEKTGKPVGNDSREGKHTYATMNGKDKTEAAIKEHTSKARSLTSGLLDLSGDSRKVMEELVEWMGTRES